MTPFHADSDNFYGDIGHVKVAVRKDCSGIECERLRHLAQQVKESLLYIYRYNIMILCCDVVALTFLHFILLYKISMKFQSDSGSTANQCINK